MNAIYAICPYSSTENNSIKFQFTVFLCNLNIHVKLYFLDKSTRHNLVVEYIFYVNVCDVLMCEVKIYYI